MRILFMGTPDFAVASLRRLVEDGHEICGVFTQPDKPKNRGHKRMPTPVKEYALTKNLEVHQPASLRDDACLELARSLEPELIVVAAYGKLLPEALLTVPPLGSVNVHSSLLPKYRGAAPINWAVLNGETVTGAGAGRGGCHFAKIHPHWRDGGRPGPHRPVGGAGGGGLIGSGQSPGQWNSFPHAPGPCPAHLRADAGKGFVPRGLDPIRS